MNYEFINSNGVFKLCRSEASKYRLDILLSRAVGFGSNIPPVPLQSFASEVEQGQHDLLIEQGVMVVVELR